MTKNSKNTKTSLLHWLEIPYHLNIDFRFKLSMSLFMGIFITLFLIVFEPASFVLVKIHSLLKQAVISGILVTLTLLFYFFVVMKLFPNYFNNGSWTLGKHIFTVIALILFCSFIFWIYIDFYSEIAGKIKFKEVLYKVFSVGIIPIFTYILIDERYGNYQRKKEENRKKEKKKEKIKNKILERNKIKTSNEIEIYSYNKKDFIKIDIENLVYITSQANYASFFVLREKKLKEFILRKPLSKIEKDLADYNYIFRNHKSFIINTRYINSISGNARGYFLDIDYCDNTIPVSRKFSKKELEELVT